MVKQVLSSRLSFPSLKRSKSLEFLPGRISRISDRSTETQHTCFFKAATVFKGCDLTIQPSSFPKETFNAYFQTQTLFIDFTKVEMFDLD